MDNFFSTVSHGFSMAQQWLFESLVQPLVFALGLANLLGDAYLATAWFMIGLIQIALLALVVGRLQRWRPVEPVTNRATIRIDILYTLIHRLGLFRIVLFITLEPWLDGMVGTLRTAGFGTLHIDQVWPGVTDGAVLSFVIYLLVFDFMGYWIHRGQHRLDYWWRLHSLHHSQRQMTMWSDNRNHLLDDVVVDSLFVVAAHLIGVAPGQFLALVAFSQLSQSLQHANLRLWFGTVGERLWVSPRFHRLHHSIGLGHESRGPQTLGGHNFGVLLPWWDMLFGTANFELRYDRTGVRDQLDHGGVSGRNYGVGFWQQQWLGLLRLVGRA
jgi:sterol desaturase/sphingolipid hydroxylase (fatty acid hydroxylase superfamily)